MKLFIIHTNHAHQIVGHEAGNADEFMEHLEKICRLHRIDLIAEEFSTEALAKSKATESTCRLLSKRIKINHIFCDPDSKQRAQLNIPTTNQILENLKFGKIRLQHQENQLIIEERKYWPLRENYWIDCIFSHEFQNCLFVCGSDHFESFRQQLFSNQICFEVIDEKWEPKA